MSHHATPIREHDYDLDPSTPDAARTDGPAPSRRTVLRTAGLVALAGGSAATLGACAADEPAAPVTTAAPSSSAPSPSPSASASSASPSASASSAAAPDGPSVATSKVPVGGGVILDDADYVITQPSRGEFKAFSKICTHQRCPVTSISDGNIICNCHNSRFSIEDGSVTNPPASQPLAESEVTVAGDKVYVTG